MFKNGSFARGIMIRFVCLSLLVATAGLGGCGPGLGANGFNGADGSFATCATETRAMPYRPYELRVRSTSGARTVLLQSSTPGPPVKGKNIWIIGVYKGDVSIDGLNISVDPYMPDNMQGTNPVIVTPTYPIPGAGEYTLDPLYLYMSGYWEVRMTLAGFPGDTATDSAMIPICIP